MNTGSTELLLTAAETAERLRIHYDTLARWRASGQGPAYVKLCGTYRYPADELEAWIRKSLTSPDQSRTAFRQSVPSSGRRS